MLKYLVVLLLISPALADKWDYFFPEYVTSISCSVAPANMMSGRDANESHDAYIAEAKAERPGLRPEMQHWAMQIAEEPLTRKGRKKAQKACDQWTDQAEDRIKAAKPINIKEMKK